MNGLLTYGLVLFFALAIIASIARHFVLMFRSYDSVLKQLVGSIKITGDQDAAFNELLAAIHAAGFTVRRTNRRKAEVVVRGLTRPADLLTHRRSNELLFAVTDGSGGCARVEVYVIPSLLRFGIATTQSVSEAEQVIAALEKTCGR